VPKHDKVSFGSLGVCAFRLSCLSSACLFFEVAMMNKIAETTKEEGCFESLSSVVDLIRKKKNILVLVGAGISVSCGIPDFRSQDGLYATLNCEEFGVVVAEDLFDYEFFKENPHPFYKFAREFFFSSASSVQPSFSHLFLAMLQEKNQLLRVYTQNIDGLEELAGVSNKHVVYAHGSLRFAQCMKCHDKVDSSHILQHIQNHKIPKCCKQKKKEQQRTKISKRKHQEQQTSTSYDTNRSIHSTTKNAIFTELTAINRTAVVTRSLRQSTTSARSSRIASDENNNHLLCNGIMKPGITFFGEKLNSDVNRMLEADRKTADAIIVIGTSLSVAPMSQVMDYLPSNIPRILINRNYIHPPSVPESSSVNGSDANAARVLPFDAYLLGNCDAVTKALASELGWIKSPKTSPNENNFFDSSLSIQVGDNPISRRATSTSSAAESTIPSNLRNASTFIFSGAVLDKISNSANNGSVSVTIHCDGCDKNIGSCSMKCEQCFDFDLCQDCYPIVSKEHFLGRHKFVSMS